VPGRRGAVRRVPLAVSEFGQLGARRRDPHTARTEIHDQGGVNLDADDPAEAVRVVGNLIPHGELLSRRSGGWGARGLVDKKRRDGARAGFINTSVRLSAVCACRAARHWFRGLASWLSPERRQRFGAALSLYALRTLTICSSHARPVVFEAPRRRSWYARST
jgi:hypothetical protein